MIIFTVLRPLGGCEVYQLIMTELVLGRVIESLTVPRKRDISTEAAKDCRVTLDLNFGTCINECTLGSLLSLAAAFEISL